MKIKSQDIKESFLSLGDNKQNLTDKGFVKDDAFCVEELVVVKETAKAYGIEDLQYEQKIAFWLPKSMIYTKK